MSTEVNTSNDVAIPSNETDTSLGATTEANETVAQNAERLLRESKKFKERALRSEKELADLKKRDLETQGNFKVMYEDLSKQYTSLKNNLVKERISSAIKIQAEKFGCTKPDTLLKLGNVELLQYDEESNEVFGSESFVEDVKSKYPEFFQTKSIPTINPTVPGGMVRQKEMSSADIAKLPQQERIKILMGMMQKR